MGAAENIATHIRWAEADDRHDLSHHHEFVHEDIEVHHLDGATIVGRDALITNMHDSIVAMPDYHVSVDDRFATDDRVLGRWRVRGTPGAGAAPSGSGGSPLQVSGISLWEFEDGRARRGWVCSNASFLMQQGTDSAHAYSIHAHDTDPDAASHPSGDAVMSQRRRPAAHPASPETVAAAENLATHMRWSEANDRHDLSRYDEYMYDDIVVYHLDGSIVRGIKAVTQNMADSIAAMPERRVVVDERFATHDRVVCRWRVTGTPRTGEAEEPLGGKPIEIAGISVWEFEGGRARRGWACSNAAALMQRGRGTAYVRAADAYQPRGPLADGA